LNNKVAVNALIKEFIISVVKDEKPENVHRLVKLVQQKYRLTEREATDLILQLENEGKIRLTQKETSPLTLKDYVFSSRATRFWATIALTLATPIAIFAIPDDAYPTVYIRYVLGAIFVLWLPGFTLVKALFPLKKEMDTIERASLRARTYSDRTWTNQHPGVHAKQLHARSLHFLSVTTLKCATRLDSTQHIPSYHPLKKR
jgi:hypothetical protein